MVWTDPNLVNWEVGDALTSADMKTYVRDNLLVLKNPPSANYEFTGSYSTTSTSFVNVDGTNLSLTITTTGGDVIVQLNSAIINTAIDNYSMFDITLDGTRQGSGNGLVYHEQDAGNDTYPISFGWLITGLAAGTHTFKLQWRVTGGTATLNPIGGKSQFWVREVS